MRSATLCSLVLALSACGGDKGTSDTATSTGEPATTGSESASDTGAAVSSGEAPTTGAGEATASSAATTDASTDASTGAATSTSTSGVTTGPGTTTTTGETTTAAGETAADTTTGATSDLVIAVVDAELFADCMPEIEPDPVQGSWFVEFDNTASDTATAATLTKASLSLLDADPPMLEEIEVSPTESGPIPAGEQTSVEVKKLKGAGHSGCQHGGQFYLLALEYQEGAVTHHVTEEVTISCAF